MKRVIIELDEEFHKQLKIFCFTNGITLKDYITVRLVFKMRNISR